MKVYCVMEKDVYDDCQSESCYALCSIWLCKDRAEEVAMQLDDEYYPYKHYVREEEAE